jgi:outer membrane protein assembly factor BamB
MDPNHPQRSAVLVTVTLVAVTLVAVVAARTVLRAPAPSTSRSTVTGTAVRPSSAAGLRFVQTWPGRSVNDASGAAIAESSPVLADLPGGPAAVVGDRAGNLYAFNLATGAQEWVVSHGGTGIDGSPSAANVGGGADSVYLGVGTSANADAGYYQALNPNGSVKWQQNATNPGTTIGSGGVAGGVAVGTLQGQTAVVGGSMLQFAHAFSATSGSELLGFPWLEADSDFSTPAIADIEGNGTNQIILGGDSTANPVPINGDLYDNGGHIRILSETGNQGTVENGGLYCEYKANQVVQSSPAVGRFLAGNGVGAVVGTGSYFAGASQTDALLAIDKHCNLAWQVNLNGLTGGSPALADVLGNGQLQVIEGTDGAGNGSGSVYALNGTNGATIWRHDNPVGAAVIGSVVTVDLGAGYQDVIDPTIQGVYVLDGRTGNTVATLETGVGTQNAPLVTDDPNGTIGITIAGYNGQGGVVEHFELAGSSGAQVNEAGAWPEFHHDPQLSGNAGTPPPVVGVVCSAPALPDGYLLAASDGGIFTYGNLPFCGSLGSLALNKPVVGLAVTRRGGGYWQVASDGGIFAFGDAVFHGSAGSIHLNKPIVAMAPTSDGGGYWLVASDGGIFAYGDARFFGSAGGIHLNKPIVAMAPTSDGGGYWLVASDGGIFAYGDAVFRGSTGGTHLNQPIVAISSDPATGGYWLVASDGGIFAFAAPFDGSAGSIHLNQPIVGMAATSRGDGYRLVASDGGIFDYGNAPFLGSAGSVHLNEPIVAMAGH